jgi:hypothetical protein
MRERKQTARQELGVRARPRPGANANQAAESLTPRSVSARALALQRRAGNRTTGRLLARWARHPDPDKKGVMVPDVVAAEFTRFNPPTNA